MEEGKEKKREREDQEERMVITRFCHSGAAQISPNWSSPL